MELQAEQVERRGEDALSEVLADLTPRGLEAENALEDAYSKVLEVCDLLAIASRGNNADKNRAVYNVWGEATTLLCSMGDVKRASY